MLLANVHCTLCVGQGAYPGRHAARYVICKCVLREIFRQCWGRYKSEREGQNRSRTSVCIENMTRGTSGRRAWRWGRPSEEFLADFELIAKRTLDPVHHAIFRLHFIEGLDWKACCKKVRMDRGDFFHSVYRVEQELGRAFAETEPYGLFPTSRYFGITVAAGAAMSRSGSIESFVGG